MTDGQDISYIAPLDRIKVAVWDIASLSTADLNLHDFQVPAA